MKKSPTHVAHALSVPRPHSWGRLFALLACAAFGQPAPPAEPGIQKGATIPAFSLPDQNGRPQSLQSLKGSKGLMLVFVRSADWCIYCKTQLVEFQQNLANLRTQGLGLAVITYDSQAILKNFSDRRGIHYALLSDEDTKTIRAFGVLNETVPGSSPFYGIPHPVTFIVDGSGKVTRKYFEENYKVRQSLSGLLSRDYGVAASAARATPKAKHIRIATSASAPSVSTGQRILLAVDIEMDKEIHVYAPGNEDYHPVEWKMAESAIVKATDVVFPKPKILFLEAIQEKVPVYEGKLRLIRDVTISPDNRSDGELTIEGSLRYQACSDRLCYPPETVPLKWTLQLTRLDTERAPVDLRKKGGV